MQGTLEKIYKRMAIKDEEVEVLQDELLYCKHKNRLIEGEIENKKEEIEILKQKNERKNQNDDREKKWLSIKKEYEWKINALNKVLKLKSRQLVKHFQRLEESLWNKFVFISCDFWLIKIFNCTKFQQFSHQILIEY